MKRLSAKTCCLVLLALTLSAAGQVSVPALVTDNSGTTIHGLHESDFMVDCGKQAHLEGVEEVTTLSFSAFSNPIPVFILFDALSVPPPVQGEVAKQLLGYLRRAADDGLAVTVLVNSDRGLELVHDMSADPNVFLTAMNRVLPSSHVKQSQSTTSAATDEFKKAVDQEVRQLQQLTKTFPYAIYKTTRSEWLSPDDEEARRRIVEKQELQSLYQTGEIFRRSRKRKLLIWLTGYFPFNIANGELTYANYAMPYGRARPKIRPEMTSAYQTAIDSLNNSRISAYPAFVPDAHNYNMQVLAKDTLDGLDELARRTGGRMLGIVDQIDLFSTIADLQHHFDSYYVLTFKFQSPKDSWIESHIQMKQQGAKVIATNGFFANN